MTGNEDVLPIEKYFSENSNIFQSNTDGTITYIGEKTAIIYIDFTSYFYTGTINNRINLKIYNNSAIVAGGQYMVSTNYVTFAATALIKVVKGDILKFTQQGTANDVISSNNSFSKLLICGSYL